MVYDLSNLVWSTRHSALVKKNKKSIEGFEREILLHEVLNTMKRAHDKYKPDGIIIACDSRNVWRKTIYPLYKANRDHERDEYIDVVYDVINTIIEFFNASTNVPALTVKQAEADDIISMVPKNTSQKIVIVSSDKDFVQLISPNVRLYAHTLKKERTTTDRGYDLFEKCIRGDIGDNIPSSFPRVRRDKLIQAWENPLDMINLMETKRKLDNKKVGEVYKFNKVLIDLNLIPTELKTDISNAIVDIVHDQNQYNQMNVLRFLGQNQLKNIAKDIDKYTPMFKKGFIM